MEQQVNGQGRRTNSEARGKAFSCISMVGKRNKTALEKEEVDASATVSKKAKKSEMVWSKVKKMNEGGSVKTNSLRLCITFFQRYYLTSIYVWTFCFPGSGFHSVLKTAEGSATEAGLTRAKKYFCCQPSALDGPRPSIRRHRALILTENVSPVIKFI